MIEALIGSLHAGLTLWKNKDARKYLDKLFDLKRDYYEEYNKPENERSNAVLDNIEHELCLIAEAFSSQVGIAYTGNQ